MTKEEMRQEVFKKMTPEQQKVAKEKAEARAQKKAEEANKAKEAQKAIEKNIEEHRMALPKRQLLREITLNLREAQTKKTQVSQDTLNLMRKLLTTEDYSILREEYIELIRIAFYFRTPVYTEPAKTLAANFLNQIMTKTKTVELGLILGMMTEKYISKSLAMVLENQVSLVKKANYDGFIFRFAQEIFDLNGTPEEDGSVTPFTPGQAARVKGIYDLYKPE